MDVKTITLNVLCFVGCISLWKTLNRSLDFSQISSWLCIPIFLLLPSISGTAIYNFRPFVKAVSVEDKTSPFHRALKLISMVVVSIFVLLSSSTSLFDHYPIIHQLSRFALLFLLINWVWNCQCFGLLVKTVNVIDSFEMGVQFLGGYQIILTILTKLYVPIDENVLFLQLLLLIWVFELLQCIVKLQISFEKPGAKKYFSKPNFQTRYKL